MIVKIISDKRRGHRDDSAAIIQLPANQYEVDDAFLQAQVKKGEGYSLHQFDDCPVFLKLALTSCRQKTLEEVNYLSYKIREMNKEQLKIYEGIVERRRHSLQESPMSIRELINATYNLECFAFLKNVTNDKMLGEIYQKEKLLSGEIKEPSDVEMVGAEVRKGKQGYFLADGFVYRVSSKEKVVYNGVLLPERMKKHSGLIALRLKSMQRPDQVTWLELPAKKQGILQAIKTIGGTSLDECIITDCQSVLPFIDDRFSCDEDINKINLLAKRLASFSEQEIKKYKAILHFEYYAELDDMLDLAQNLDCYDHDPEITNPAGYAESVLQKAGIDIGDPAFSRFDFYGLGLRLLEKRGIMFTPYGIVKRNESSFKYELTSPYPKMTPV